MVLESLSLKSCQFLFLVCVSVCLLVSVIIFHLILQLNVKGELVFTLVQEGGYAVTPVDGGIIVFVLTFQLKQLQN